MQDAFYVPRLGELVVTLFQASDYLTTEEFIDAIADTLKMNLITHQEPHSSVDNRGKLSNPNWDHYAPSEHNSDVVSRRGSVIHLIISRSRKRHANCRASLQVAVLGLEGLTN